MVNPAHVLGEKFRIDDSGAVARSAPSIAALAGSQFIAGYSSISNSDADQNAVSGQIFTATGLDSGGDFHLHTATADIQTDAQVEALPGGGFVAFWETQTLSTRTVLAQLFDASGAKVGAELALKSGGYGGAGAISPLVTTVLANGNLLLLWNDNSGVNPIRGQVYGQSGEPIGAETSINGAIPGGSGGGIARLPNGGFVYSWNDPTSTLGDTSVARFLDANGIPVGDAFLLNTETAGSQSSATLSAFADGGFVAVWVSALNGRQDLKGQIFDATGAKFGSEFLVNVPDNTYNNYPSVAVLTDGSFVVTWQRPSYYYNAQGFLVDQGYGITAQAFEASGAKIAGQFWVDSTNANRYSGPTIEAMADGGYVIGWYDQKFNLADSDATGLKARIFGPNSLPDITSGVMSAPENEWQAGQVVVTDLDVNAKLTFAITGGIDAARFTIDAATGMLRWIYPADFEAPTDSDSDNIYHVTVRVSDSHATDSQDLTLTVANVDEAPRILQYSGSAPGIAYVDENTTAVATILAIDPEGAAVSFMIVGGTDAAQFAIDPQTGALRFLLAPDYELPGDADADNIYHVTISASDGTQTSLVSIDTYVFNRADGLILSGNAKANTLTGAGSEDAISGLGGNDSLRGLAGSDDLDGGSGNDSLTGGTGADLLIGGTGRDTFVYGTLADSTWDQLDTITDFSRTQGDRISLSAIDANSVRARDQSFSFIGTAEFSQVAGQLHYFQTADATYIEGDVDGDGLGDFLIKLDGLVDLNGSDFML